MMAQDEASFCPYVGLRPYDEEHREYFFGRTGDIRVIYSTVLAVPLSVLYGASGVGKSSVLLAGVIPELRLRQKTAIVVFREWQRPDALAALKGRCVEAASLAHGSPIEVDLSLPLDEILARARKVLAGTFVILLDQFEEYFLYHPESEGGDGFDGEFARSVNRADVDAGFLLSMREDGLSKLDRFKVRIPNMLSNMIRLAHLDEKSAEEAIVKPLGVFNDRVHPEPPYSVEPELVKVILRQVTSVSPTGTPGAQIETPLLQLVMERLWFAEQDLGSRALRLQTFNDRLRDVQSLLQTHLASVMSVLDAAEQALCARFFDRLVTPSGSKLACRLDDLVNYADADEQTVRSVAEKLDRNRILRRIDPPPGQTVPSYEIFHDVLAPAILAWRQQYLATENESRARAQATAEADEKAREAIRQQEMDSARALAHEQELRAAAERDRADAERLRADNEAKGAKRFRTLAWSLAVMTVVAVGMSISAYRHSNLADENRIVAMENGQVAMENATLAASQRDVATARDLAGQARSNLSADPELSLILATRAASVVHPPPAEVISALNESVFATRMRKMLPPETPHTQLGNVVVTADGAYLATVSNDGVVIIRDASTLEMRGRLDGQLPDSGVIAFSGDSALFAAAASKTRISIWRTKSCDSARTEQCDLFRQIDGLTSPVTQIAFSPTGDAIASGGIDGTVTLWSVDTGKAMQPPINPSKGSEIRTLAFSPDGARLVTGSEDATIKVWNTRNLKERPTALKGHNDGVESVAFSADGKLLVSSSTDRKVIVWNTATWQRKFDLGSQHDTIFAARFGARDRLIATGGSDGSAKIWDARSGKELFELNGHKRPISALAFSRDGERLFTASWDGTLRVWDVSPVHLETIVDLAFSPDDKFIATASRDRTAMIWDAVGGEVVRTLRGHADSLARIHFSPDSSMLLTADEGTAAILWNSKTGELLHRFNHGDVITDARFSPKGSFVATAAKDGIIRRWDAKTGKALPEFARTDFLLNALAVSPDETRLAAASDDGEIVVWDLASGKRSFEAMGKHLRHGEKGALAVVYSPDGALLASSGRDNTVRIWNALTGDPMKTLAGHTDQVLDLAFSPSGNRLVSVSLDNTAIVWDVATWAGRTLIGHSQAVVRAKFNADGSRVATASWDRTAKVWDAESGKELLSLTHAGPVEAAEFSADGSRLATAGGDGALRLNYLWDTDRLLKLAAGRTTRSLTPNECARYLPGADCSVLR